MGKLLLPVLALTALAGPALAQDYPTRPVRAIVAVAIEHHLPEQQLNVLKAAEESERELIKMLVRKATS